MGSKQQIVIGWICVVLLSVIVVFEIVRTFKRPPPSTVENLVLDGMEFINTPRDQRVMPAPMTAAERDAYNDSVDKIREAMQRR